MSECSRKIKLFLLPVIIMVMAGCADNFEPEEAPISIKCDVNEIELSPGGTVEIPYVLSGDNPYNWNLTMGACEVVLVRSDGQTPKEYYVLKSLRDDARNYRLVIAGRDGVDGVDEYFQFFLTRGSSDVVRSTPIHVKGVQVPVPPANPEDDKGVFKTGLPTIYVNTGYKTIEKGVWTDATIKVDGLGEEYDIEETPIQIKGRGNTTWTWPKKPYAIRFEKRTSVFGLPEHKRWILLANFMDRTLIRNSFAYTISSLTSLAWTPRYKYCELVLDGKHMGNYMFIEQVRVDENRVAINEDGGLLFELDFHYDNRWQWLDYHGKCNNWYNAVPFAIKYPDEEEVTWNLYTQAKDYINSVASVLYGSMYQDPDYGYRKYLDVQSFADYWIVYELLVNHELGNPGSVYMHKDPDGLLTMGPAWDFDWGGLSFNTSPAAQNGLILRNAIWYGRLNDDPWFRQLVAKRWAELKPLFEAKVSYFDEMKEYLSASAALNFRMWNPAEDKSMNGGWIINGDEEMTFEDAIDKLKSNYKRRLLIMEREIADAEY